MTDTTNFSLTKLAFLNPEQIAVAFQHLRMALPETEARSDDELKLAIDNAFAHAVQAAPQLFFLEGVYADNDQLFSSHNFEVPKGCSVFELGIRLAMKLSWNEKPLSATELKCLRTGRILPFSLLPGDEALELAEKALTTSDSKPLFDFGQTLASASAVTREQFQLLMDGASELVDIGHIGELWKSKTQLTKAHSQVETFCGTTLVAASALTREYVQRMLDNSGSETTLGLTGELSKSNAQLAQTLSQMATTIQLEKCKSDTALNRTAGALFQLAEVVTNWSA